MIGKIIKHLKYVFPRDELIYEVFVNKLTGGELIKRVVIKRAD